jgi:flagellar biosynthetic protein FliP
MRRLFYKRKWLGVILLASLFFSVFGSVQNIYAGAIIPDVTLTIGGTDDPEGVVPALQVLFLISIISLAPSLLILLTGFLRIVVVLTFVRQAMATQQMPPSQIIVGIALFLTIFLMTPVFQEINEQALIPLGAGEISTAEAIDAGMAPIRTFMYSQTSERDLWLFLDLAGETYTGIEDVGNHILIPAFILSELTTAFIMGFFIYLPFIVIDMVTASVLMAMGMMMLPPAMISMPFKIMTFLLAGGWGWIIEGLMLTFE